MATPEGAGRPKLVLDVYVVTAAGLVPGRSHAEVAVGAIEGGANAVQLRAPEHGDEELLPLARELADRCRERGVLFIVNNRVELALACGAAGVHLGRGDPWAAARPRVGPAFVLGVSVEDVDQARAAEAAGADYLGVTVFASATKPEAVAHGLRGLREISAATALPVVGIGGIGTANARQVLTAGAAGVAVISAVAGAPDPAAATRELVAAVRGTTGARPFRP
ncbi:MAG TPA: thiamine phosphate synthase [Actinomycetes bacterium]|jgi:thiamine-phosphate pyrophosphorylase|nr:thiamine phosphate synthase [Actinomycetes bacterium]